MSEPTEGPLLSNLTAQEALQPLISCSIAFLIVSTLFVAGRLVSRFVIRKLPFWWDDFWVLPAYACNIGACAIGLYMAYTEISWNNEDRIILNLAELNPLLKAIFVIEQLVVPAYALTRFSILALYLRIFSDKGVRLACWIMAILIAAQWFAFSFAFIFQCTPVPYFWDRTIAGGHCVNINRFYRSVTIPNIIQDVVIVVLPIPTVWQLKATRLRKWGLTLVFCIGTSALVASCIRLWVFEVHTSELIAPEYTSVLISWLIIEPGIYILAACLPAMHHLFAAIVPQKVQDKAEQKLAGIRHPLSGRGAPSPNNNRVGLHPLYGQFTKLSDGNTITTSSTNNKNRKGSGSKNEEHELESGTGRWPVPENAIMVTTEVIITQEERIADVLGF